MKEPRDILAPLRDFQVIQFINKNNENATLNLPPGLIRLIGLYMLIDKLKQLLGLVEFMKEQGGINGTGQIDEVSNTLKEAISQNKPGLFVQIYNAAFDTVVALIGDSGVDLLLAAAQAGNRLAVAQLLMVNGIDMNAANNHGNTALMLVAWGGHEDLVVQLLKKNGIEVNFVNNSGTTALMGAAGSGYEAVVVALLKKNGIEVNIKNQTDITALMRAAWDGHEAVVAALLKMDDIDVNAKSNDGTTALMGAALAGHEAVVHALCLKQLFDAPSDAADATLQRLNAEIEEVSMSMTITPLSLHDHLLASLNKLPTQDEKTALLNKALSNGNAFSALMQQAGLKQRIQTELGKLNTPSIPVIFSTAPPTEPRAARNSTCSLPYGPN